MRRCSGRRKRHDSYIATAIASLMWSGLGVVIYSQWAWFVWLFTNGLQHGSHKTYTEREHQFDLIYDHHSVNPSLAHVPPKLGCNAITSLQQNSLLRYQPQPVCPVACNLLELLNYTQPLPSSGVAARNCTHARNEKQRTAIKQTNKTTKDRHASRKGDVSRLVRTRCTMTRSWLGHRINLSVHSERFRSL